MTINDLYMDDPYALLMGGPHNGKLVPVTGPWEVHFEKNEGNEEGIEFSDGRYSEYHVIPRGKDDWKFPIHYRFSAKESCR